MADLSGDDRGQLILVAAFAIAVIFVSLALVVNSAIFTENLASRGETSGSEGALSMRAMVETNAGTMVEAVNRADDTGDAALEDAIERNIRTLSVQTERQQVRTGRIVDVSLSTHTEGIRIAQNDSTTFQNSSGEVNYTVADGVERAGSGNGTRAFRINASDIAATSNSSAFEILVNDSGTSGLTDSWRVRIYRDGPDTVHVRTLRNDGGTTDVADCEVTREDPDGPFRIDVTGGTVDGEPCDALGTTLDGGNFHFGSGTGGGTYDIYFRNADEITGNFSLVVHDSGTTATPSLNESTAHQPYTVNALYGVTVRYTYVTSDLHYETDVRVAPGEPDV